VIGISKLYLGQVEPSDALRYGRHAGRLPSHLPQFSRDNHADGPCLYLKRRRERNPGAGCEVNIGWEAILLVGPTGAGKTPLGEFLEAQGLFGRRCVHFDFGAQLRRAAEEGGRGLSPDDVATVRKVLREGALLENDTFHIARRILNDFLREREVGHEDLVILNGLPRHAGQARDVAADLKVTLVVALTCTAAVVHERIARNSGGDRTERTDDSVEAIERKLEIYAARTQPLLDHYRAKGVQPRLVPVGIRTTPADLLGVLNAQRLDSEQ
jgi:adenylate kinase family enzyme